MKMMLFVIFVSLFVECAMQEFGEVQQFIGLVFGNQMNSMMSSCCVIRELQCPVQRQYRPASYHNASADFSRGLESFSRCVCTNNTQCVLTLPPSFLPDRADGVKFDVTFVTASTTTQYTCTYNGTRALVCQYRQSMRTEMLSWVMPNFTGRGYGGTLQAMGNAGLLGEEMEEVMEQMVESGIPHIQAPRPNSQCRRCVPLQCGVTVSREAQRLRLMMRRTSLRRTSLRRTSLPAVRRRYHQCLMQNSIRPPVPVDPVTTTTLPPSTFPLILPLTPPPDPSTLPPPPTPKPTTRRTTITTTTRKTTTTTTTTKRPTTKRTTPKPVIVTTPKPAPPVVQITTPENLTTKPVPIATTTPAVEVTTKTSVTPSATSATTTTPQEFTRILVGSDTGTTSAPSTRDAVKDLTETREGGSTSIGGGRIAGVIIGIVVAAAVVFIWLFFLFRRRRRKHREVEVSVNPVVAGKHTSSGGVLGSKLHYKARPLPTVSSRKAVIDAVDADDQFEKSDDDDDDDDSEVENPPNKARERYTTPPSSRKSSLATKQSFRDDDSQHYASLDELAITSTQNTLPINVISVTAASGVVGSAPATGGDSAKRSSKESGKYYNMEGVATAENVTGQSSSSSGDASKRPTKESKKYFNMDGTDSAKGDTGSGGSDKYYNLKPGAASPRPGAAYTEVTLSSDTGNVNYVNTTSPSASLYETPCLQPSQSHLYTSLKIKGKPSNASIKSNSSTVSRTESDPNYVKASVTFQSPRGGDVYSEPYGSVRANNGRPGIGDQSQGSNSSSRTTASQESSKPPTPTSTSPKVDNDGYLLPVTPRKQQRR